MWNLRMVNFDNPFYIFNFCEELLRFFSDVTNWYQIFTHAKNRSQILARAKIRTKSSHLRIIGIKSSHMKNWYQNSNVWRTGTKYSHMCKTGTKLSQMWRISTFLTDQELESNAKCSRLLGSILSMWGIRMYAIWKLTSFVFFTNCEILVRNIWFFTCDSSRPSVGLHNLKARVTIGGHEI